VKTPLGCNVSVTDAPAHLGDGVMLRLAMDPPDDRRAEVYLSVVDQAELSKLLQVEQFVLVTRATSKSGSVTTHTYGPFSTRSRAQTERTKAHRSAEKMGYELEISICKVIDTEAEWQ
jgi:hypothetical protein